MRNAPLPGPLAVCLMASLVSALASRPAHAAAYYVGEIGARSLARGGAHIVRPSDPSAAWLNPAALSHAKGVQLDIDLNLVFLSSQFIRDCAGVVQGCAPSGAVERRYETGTYTVGPERPPPDERGEPVPAEENRLGELGTPSRFDGQTAVSNQAGVQPVPRVMFSWNGDTFGVDGIAFGAYVFAPNNGDYAFGADTPTRYTLIDRDLLEVYYGVAGAFRYQHWIAIGAGLQFVTAGVKQRVRLSADQYGDEIPGYDIEVDIDVVQHLIPSGNFGVWSNPGKMLGIGDLEIGSSLQLAREVRATGPIAVTVGDRVQAEFIDAGLIAFDADNAIATAQFDLAPIVRGGLRYGNDVGGVAFDVEADFVYEMWSVYDHVFLQTNGALVDRNPRDDQPGEELDPVIQPKDWTDAWSVRLGGSVALFDKRLEVHGGGYYETSAIPNETYSVELVCGDKVGVGVGVSGTLAGVRLDVGYGHVFIFDRIVGPESIVFNSNAGPSIFVDGETRTKVAMGRYTSSFDMINVALNLTFDDIIAAISGG